MGKIRWAGAVVFAASFVVTACTPDPTTTSTTMPPLTVPDPALNVVVAAQAGSVDYFGDDEDIIGPLDVGGVSRLGLVVQPGTPCGPANVVAEVRGRFDLIENGVPTTMVVPLFSTRLENGLPVYFSEPIPPQVELRVHSGNLGTSPTCDYRVALWGTTG